MSQTKFIPAVLIVFICFFVIIIHFMFVTPRPQVDNFVDSFSGNGHVDHNAIVAQSLRNDNDILLQIASQTENKREDVVSTKLEGKTESNVTSMSKHEAKVENSDMPRNTPFRETHSVSNVTRTVVNENNTDMNVTGLSIKRESVVQILSANNTSNNDSEQFFTSPQRELSFVEEQQFVLNQSTDISLETFKTILIWNEFYQFSFPTIDFNTCEVSKCIQTFNKSDLDTADAVVIHTFMIGPGKAKIPYRISRDQIFVFVLIEPPYIANMAHWLSGMSDVFNLTFTYMHDSDITNEYGKFVKKHTDSSYIGETAESISKKKLAFWVVSNCNPSSLRTEYANELRRYIPVDIYGKCGNMTCERKVNDNCFKEWAKEYLFLLSFENSVCVDYGTEKVFDALTLPIVPIVLGGFDYAKYLPPHSYIDVKDFRSPEKLANYLKYLRTNVTAYNEYHIWKPDYHFLHTNQLREQGFCKLCSIMHNKTYKFKSNWDPEEYFNADKLCLNKTQQRKLLLPDY